MDVDYGPIWLKAPRARVQKGDCVYSIVIALWHSSAELAHSQARLLYGWRTFLVQNGYSEPRWDLSVLQSASQSVVHNITSALAPLQGTVIKLDSSCLSLWAHNLLQGPVNIDGIRTLWFSYHDP